MKRTVFISFFILLFLPACPTIWQFNALKKQTLVLQEKNKQLKEQLLVYEKRISNLDKKYDKKVTGVVHKGADYKSDIDSVNHKIARLQGKFEEFEFHSKKTREQLKKISDFLDDKMGVNITSVPDEVPKDKNKLFDYASTKLSTGDAKSARGLFRAFIKKYPSDSLTDDAQFMIGETFLYEKKYNEAINEYRAIYDHYKKSNKMADALIRIAECYENIGDCKKAAKLYKFSFKYIKKKAQKNDIKSRLKKIKKLCR